MVHLFTDSLRDWLAAPWLHIALCFAASAGGAIVGAEREKREKPAGLRTLVLVCLGSATFTMASYAFTSTTGDSGRVAAQIVTGIGFLGAGAILHSASSITGMTTAATIWITAAIGMVAGTGYAIPALALSILVRILLNGIYAWEMRRLHSLPPTTIRFVIDPAHGKTRIRVEKVMDEHRVRDVTFDHAGAPNGHIHGTATFSLPEHRRRDFLYALANIPEVLEIESPPSVKSEPPR